MAICIPGWEEKKKCGIFTNYCIDEGKKGEITQCAFNQNTSEVTNLTKKIVVKWL